ncbi:hypothetical protein DYB32_004401 [Aphanomyces invadans]|uniref:PH domain-containing protein n=1 Tax=Aphanomyces invadans TaxID=157072 RepID=A0A3R6YZM7_9STRA|nr:hypothetical protein DYB32_004401 [Aphanomyces invadans]
MERPMRHRDVLEAQLGLLADDIVANAAEDLEANDPGPSRSSAEGKVHDSEVVPRRGIRPTLSANGMMSARNSSFWLQVVAQSHSDPSLQTSSRSLRCSVRVDSVVENASTVATHDSVREEDTSEAIPEADEIIYEHERYQILLGWGSWAVLLLFLYNRTKNLRRCGDDRCADFAQRRFVDDTQLDRKSGWLYKQGHILKNWKRRFFVLDGSVLRYFSEDVDATVPKSTTHKLKGEVLLFHKDTTVHYVDIHLSGRDFTFAIDTSGGEFSLMLQASSLDEREDWIYAIEDAILCRESYQDSSGTELKQNVEVWQHTEASPPYLLSTPHFGEGTRASVCALLCFVVCQMLGVVLSIRIVWPIILQVLERYRDYMVQIKQEAQIEHNYADARDTALLNQMDNYSLPFEKGQALMEAATSIYTLHAMEHDTPTSMPNTSPHLAADDFLPIFIYVVCQSRLRQVLLTRRIVSETMISSVAMGEVGYYSTMLEAAVEFIALFELPTESKKGKSPTNTPPSI